MSENDQPSSPSDSPEEAQPALPAAAPSVAEDSPPQPQSAESMSAESMPAEPSAGPRAAPLSPAECAQQLRQLFPALFAGAVKPLKLRIQVDIQERAPGKFSRQTLSAFFRRHTGSTAYLIAVSKATHRFDLDGQPAGEMSEEHRKAAADELARRRASHDERRALEDRQRQLEEQQRRNRAGLLHDFQTTTLTPANFCALKGVAVDELEGLLTIARAEVEERARHLPPPHMPRAPGSPNSPNSPQRPTGFDRQRRGPPGGGNQRPRNQR